MKVSTLNKGIGVLVALAIAGLLLVSALPLAASTRVVRDRIAQELSLWSGYRVQLAGTPSLQVWPVVRATLNDVTFREWGGGDNPPVLEADRIDIDLAALAALRGEVVFSSIRITRPVLRLSREGAVVDLPAAPAGGRMRLAVSRAQELVEANPSAPDLAALPADPFGTVEFSDGRILAATGEGGGEFLVTGLSGRISWPALNRPATLSASGTWRAETITLEAGSQQPLILLAGGNAPATFALRSALLNGNFSGIANLSPTSFLDGDASLSSPSLRRTLEWSRTEIAPGAAVGPVSVSGRVSGNGSRLRIDNVAMEIGGNTGKGVLDIAFNGAVPHVAGTLDFPRLDLGSFLTAFSPLAAGTGTIYEPIDIDFADQIALDLRLSAAQAVLGSSSFDAMAATARVEGELAAFDISDATAFGGTIQAGLRIDRADGGNTVEMRLLANGVDAGAIAQKWGVETMRPHARADFSVMLRGSGADWNTAMANARGSASATLGPGTIAGFNYPRFVERGAEAEFFALSEVADGVTPIRGAQFRADVQGGVARIDTAEVLLEGRAISIGGIVPYFGRALALSGEIVPLGPDGTRGEPEAAFFIGGAWDTPFVWPVMSGYELR